MMLRHAVRTAVLVAAAGGLAACAATTAGTPHTGAPGGSGQPAATVEFGQRLLSAVQTVTSAHVHVTTALTGQPIVADGDETLRAGTLTGYRITETLPGQSTPLTLVYAGGKTYAQPPATMNDTGKPWVLVSPTSSNPFVRTLALTLGQLQSSTSISSFGTFAAAASGLRVVGNETVGGVQTTHYAFTVEVARLPNSFAAKQLLQQAGITTLPVEVWLDQQNRPVQVVQRLNVGGQQTTTTVGISRYDVPVTITAPPADQVSTD